MRLSVLPDAMAIVPGAILAQSLEVVGAPSRRWRVEAISQPGGLAHARLVSQDDRRQSKTLALDVLTQARGWSGT